MKWCYMTRQISWPLARHFKLSESGISVKASNKLAAQKYLWCVYWLFLEILQFPAWEIQYCN